MNYIDSKTAVCIICHKKDRIGNEHGKFYQSPNNHLNGNGCPKCAQEIRNDSRRLNKEELIKRIYDIYGNMYDTSKIEEYINNTTPVTLICKKHGEFQQTPGSLFIGRGCKQCGEERRLKKINDYFKSTFEQRANEVHNFKYIYTDVDYKGMLIPVKIICPIHGEFWQKPVNHLNGCGCQQCARDMVISSDERGLRDFVSYLVGNVRYNDREILPNQYELDIVIDNKKLQ